MTSHQPAIECLPDCYLPKLHVNNIEHKLVTSSSHWNGSNVERPPADKLVAPQYDNSYLAMLKIPLYAAPHPSYNALRRWLTNVYVLVLNAGLRLNAILRRRSQFDGLLTNQYQVFWLRGLLASCTQFIANS
jgi:hypothetical protein